MKQKGNEIVMWRTGTSLLIAVVLAFATVGMVSLTRRASYAPTVLWTEVCSDRLYAIQRLHTECLHRVIENNAALAYSCTDDNAPHFPTPHIVFLRSCSLGHCAGQDEYGKCAHFPCDLSSPSAPCTAAWLVPAGILNSLCAGQDQNVLLTSHISLLYARGVLRCLA